MLTKPDFKAAFTLAVAGLWCKYENTPILQVPRWSHSTVYGYNIRLVGFFDESEAALAARDWVKVHDCCYDVLALDPDDQDGRAFLAAAKRALQDRAENAPAARSVTSQSGSVGAVSVADEVPQTVITGRYTLAELIGEGARKRVYAANDSLLDRQVALALIKTEDLDPISRQHITLEAQAMGRLGSHPHIVTVYDFGEYQPDDPARNPSRSS